MTQSTIYFTSFQRASMLALSISITRNYKFLPLRNFSTEAAKQGPALGVIPVFTPDQPYLSILFVFSHFNTSFTLIFRYIGGDFVSSSSSIH